MHQELCPRIERVHDRLFEREEPVMHLIERIVGPLGLARWKRQREDASVRNRGEHELKGVPDRWRLYRVVNA